MDDKQLKPLTEGQKIWNDISNRPIAMFGIVGKLVKDYCQFFPVEPSKCFVKYTVPAFLPMVEDLLNKDYEVQSIDKLTISISRK